MNMHVHPLVIASLVASTATSEHTGEALLDRRSKPIRLVTAHKVDPVGGASLTLMSAIR